MDSVLLIKTGLATSLLMLLSFNLRSTKFQLRLRSTVCRSIYFYITLYIHTIMYSIILMVVLKIFFARVLQILDRMHTFWLLWRYIK